jgi:hypothetical protein
MREMMHKSFEFRVSSFGFTNHYERKASPFTAVSSFPRTRESRLIWEATTTERLVSRYRGNDDSGRSEFFVEFVKQNTDFGFDTKPETRNPKQGGKQWVLKLLA